MANTSDAKAAWIREALERYERPLLRYAASIVGDTDRARDVVQDTFLKLCTANRAAVETHLAAWLYTVCRNRALDVRKKEARMLHLQTSEAEARPSGGLTPSETAAARETHALVFRAVGRMPVKNQEAFRLKFNDGLSYREIAEVMGVSLGAVSNWMTTTLLAVREELGPQLQPAQEGG